MKTKYMTTRSSCDVHEVQIERETEKYVVTKAGDREAKRSRWINYWDTAEEAGRHLLAREEGNLRSAEISVGNYKKNVDHIKHLYV